MCVQQWRMLKLFLLVLFSLNISLSYGSSNSIEQMEHIIIFMQENRAFDHYFGTLRGVRGFNDRAVIPLRSGLPVFYQPTNQSDLSSYMLPFRAIMKETSASCMDAPEMNYGCDIRMWNKGHFDSWNTGRSPGIDQKPLSFFSASF
jgi:phospholipase C